MQECQGRVSHREFLLWCEWLRLQWNEPSRTDHYLMAVALELRLIRESFSQTPRPVSLDQMRVKFQFRKVRKTLSGKPIHEPGTLTAEDILNIKIGADMARLGLNPKTGRPFRTERMEERGMLPSRPTGERVEPKRPKRVRHGVVDSGGSGESVSISPRKEGGEEVLSGRD